MSPSRARTPRPPMLPALTIPLLALGLACGGDPTGPRTGSLGVAITGLAPGLGANVLVTGPDSYSQLFETSDTVADIEPGAYTVTASDAARSPGPAPAVASVPGSPGSSSERAQA